MAPKIGSDEDGDIPPCSVMDNYNAAKRWDDWKQDKYGGAQKAQPAVGRFKHMWLKQVVQKPPVEPVAPVRQTSCLPSWPFSWIKKSRF